MFLPARLEVLPAGSAKPLTIATKRHEKTRKGTLCEFSIPNNSNRQGAKNAKEDRDFTSILFGVLGVLGGLLVLLGALSLILLSMDRMM
jgi:hypothetical protein